MNICQIPGFESKADISCSCNHNLKLCIEHFVKHKDSLSQHVHNPIIILDIKNKITQAVKEKNEMMLNTKTFLILNANEMIKEIITETKRLCDEIDKEFDKIKFCSKIDEYDHMYQFAIEFYKNGNASGIQNF